MKITNILILIIFLFPKNILNNKNAADIRDAAEISESEETQITNLIPKNDFNPIKIPIKDGIKIRDGSVSSAEEMFEDGKIPDLSASSAEEMFEDGESHRSITDDYIHITHDDLDGIFDKKNKLSIGSDSTEAINTYIGKNKKITSVEERENQKDVENIEKMQTMFQTYKLFLNSLELPYKNKTKKDLNIKNGDFMGLYYLFEKVNLNFVIELENICLKSDVNYKICMKWSQYVIMGLKKIPYVRLLERFDYVAIFIKRLTLKLEEFWPIHELFEGSVSGQKKFNELLSDADESIVMFKEFFLDGEEEMYY